MYNRLYDSFSAYFESFKNALPDIIIALAILAVFIVIGKMLNRLFRRRVQKSLSDKLISSFISQVIKWTFYIIGLVLALDIIGFGKIAASMVAGAGISAIIFGFAFKDIAENFLAGILLAFNRPFKVGDIIQVGSNKGPIRSIDLRNTHIKTVDGRDIYIPNSILIKDVLINYTIDGFIRLEFMVGVDQNDDLDKARDLILGHLKKHTEILKKPEPNAVFENIGTNSVEIKVFFWVDLFSSTTGDQVLVGEPVRSRLMREIVEMLLRNGFNLPSTILEHKNYKPDQPITVQTISRNSS